MPNTLTWKEFEKVEMRIGTIIEVTQFTEARNPSYKLKIDFGDFGIKKSSAQITNLYSVHELLGRQIIAVVSFPPKQIANMMSECLVLGAIGNEKDIILIAPDRVVENGLRIG